MKLMKYKIYTVVTLSLCALFLAGCAETVTSKDFAGNKLRLELTLDGSVSAQAKYYLIVSNTQAPTYPDLSLNPYLIGPGESYDSEAIIIGDSKREISYYYANYFSTWADYLVSESNSVYLTAGPFPVTADSSTHYSYTRQTIGQNLSTTTNLIILNFDLSYLNKGAAFTNLYFNILAIDSAKKLQDVLDISEQIQNVLGEVKTGTDPDDASLAQGLDILQWRISIE